MPKMTELSDTDNISALIDQRLNQSSDAHSPPSPPTEGEESEDEADAPSEPPGPITAIPLKLGIVAFVMAGLDIGLFTTMYGVSFHELTTHSAYLTTLCDLVGGAGVLCAEPFGSISVQSVMSGLLAACGTFGLVGIFFLIWRFEIWRDFQGVFKDTRKAPIAVLATLCLMLIICLEFVGWNSLIYEATRHRIHNPGGMHIVPRSILSAILTLAQIAIGSISGAVYAKLFNHIGENDHA